MAQRARTGLAAADAADIGNTPFRVTAPGIMTRRPRHRKACRPAVTLVIGLALLGCAGQAVEEPWHRTGPGAMTDPPDLRGTVTAVSGILIRVEAAPTDSSNAATAVVRLTPLTWVADARGDRLTMDAIAVGQRVAVWFTGVATGPYPIEGEGLRIIVE